MFKFGYYTSLIFRKFDRLEYSHYHNAQEAIVKILTDYIQQYKKQANIAELLTMPDGADIDFDPPRLQSTMFHPADFK